MEKSSKMTMKTKKRRKMMRTRMI